MSALRGMREIMADRRPPAWMLSSSALGNAGAGESPEAFWQVLEADRYEVYEMDDRCQLRRIRDTAAFTREHARDQINVWAVQRAPSGSVADA